MTKAAGSVRWRHGPDRRTGVSSQSSRALRTAADLVDHAHDPSMGASQQEEGASTGGSTPRGCRGSCHVIRASRTREGSIQRSRLRR